MTPLLAVDGLVQHFETRAGTVRAVDGVSFHVGKGETLGLVGESGCGKSSVARSIAGLYRITGGSVRLDGTEISRLSRAALKRHRSQIQMVFQNPGAALNPRLAIGRLIEEPLIVHGRGSSGERKAQVFAVMEKVGLRRDLADRLPHELSGGQRQRVCIARALALSPSLIICDEAVSALDVSVQAQVVNLLRDLQQELGISYLFISHGLSITRYISHRLAVMYLGRIVEEGPAGEVFTRPKHPYTRALLAAAPSLEDGRADGFAMLDGELPSPLAPPPGCHFHTRCPFAVDRCKAEPPPLRQFGDQRVACHRVEEIAPAAT
jgi:peptide/nickel transport system ATP-binding protein